MLDLLSQSYLNELKPPLFPPTLPANSDLWRNFDKYKQLDDLRKGLSNEADMVAFALMIMITVLTVAHGTVLIHSSMDSGPQVHPGRQEHRGRQLQGKHTKVQGEHAEE